MKVGIPLEIRAHEQRVAVTPETIKKMVKMGCEVIVEKSAGEGANIPDAAFKEAGARLASAKEAFSCPLVLKVRAPEAKEIKTMKSGTVLIGMLEPFNQTSLQAMAKQVDAAQAARGAAAIMKGFKK